MKRFPQHAALDMLLEQGQFAACRMVAEQMIEQLMARPCSEGDQPVSRWQEHDLELAYLHYALSKCLFGLDEYETAAIKADMAGLLARKVNDLGLFAEAVHLAGACYGQAGSYRMAVQHFTQCLAHAEGLLRAKAYYNRGHAYERQGAFNCAVADYEEAICLAEGLDPRLVRSAKANLAWDLILLKEFTRAEQLLEELGETSDQVVQAQIAHDRLHMSHLQGRHMDAVMQAVQALRQVGQQYQHVRARIALSAMSMASEQGLHEQASIFGILGKRLAGQAKRPDIDEEASRYLQDLEVKAGTAVLAQSLEKTRQTIASGSGGQRSVTRRGTKAGGVG